MARLRHAAMSAQSSLTGEKRTVLRGRPEVVGGGSLYQKVAAADHHRGGLLSALRAWQSLPAIQTLVGRRLASGGSIFYRLNGYSVPLNVAQTIKSFPGDLTPFWPFVAFRMLYTEALALFRMEHFQMELVQWSWLVQKR
jgi:hypothetical protein